MSSLVYDSSEIDKLTDNYFGTYLIQPGQFALLDNQLIELTKNHLRFILAGSPNRILEYNIIDFRLRYFNGQPVNALELKITGLNKYNIPGNYDETVNLITNLLYLRPPSVIYITYEPEQSGGGIYTLKNINMATLAVLTKVPKVLE